MSKCHCHYCQKLKGLIILRTGQCLCPRCQWNLRLDECSLPPVLRKQFKFSPVIDPRGTLDYIGAQLMANFLYNGMSITKLARQMGITRHTVYTRLRKFELIHKTDDDKIRLQPTWNDLHHAGITPERLKKAIAKSQHKKRKVKS